MKNEELSHSTIKYFSILLSCIGIIYISNQLNIDWLKSYSNDTNTLLNGYSILAKTLFRIFSAIYIVLFGVMSIIGETICISRISYETIKSKKYKDIIYVIGIMFLLGILTYAYVIQVNPFLIIIKEISIILVFIIIVALFFGTLYSL